MANADFEGGEDDHGYGDCIFLVIYAQPSHIITAAGCLANYGAWGLAHATDASYCACKMQVANASGVSVALSSRCSPES